MRKVQFLIIIILMIIGFTISNEFYIDYISSFSDLSVLDINNRDEKNKENIIMLNEYAKKSKTELCVVVNEINSAYSSKMKVFCSEELKNTLEKQRYLIAGKHKGFISGTVNIEYDSLENLSDNDFDKVIEKTEIYVYGESRNVSNFRSDISQFCDVNISKGNGDYMLIQAQRSSLYIWGIILFVVFLFSYYVLETEKKENIIKISLGANTKILVLKNIAIEFFLICGSFEIARYIFSYVQITDFNINSVRTLVYVAGAICAFMQVSIVFFDISKVLSNAIISKDLVFLNYLLKLLATTIITILVVSCVGNVKEYYEFRKSEEYYSYFKNHNSVTVKARKREVIDDLWYYEEKLFRDNLNSKKLIYFVDDTAGDNGVNIISANKYSVEYIKDRIKEFSDYDFKEKIYIIYNENDELSNQAIEEAKSISRRMYVGESEPEYVMLPYKKSEVIGYISKDALEKTGVAKNPIIVLNNISDYRKCEFKSPVQYGIMFKLVLWDCTEEEIAEEVKKIDPDNNINVVVTNAYDKYLDELVVLQRMAMFKIGIIVILIIIYIIVNRLLVQILYTADSIEIAVKKTLGYNVFNRYKKMYIFSFVFDTLAVLYTKYYTGSIKYSGIPVSIFNILSIGAVLIFFDIIILSICVYRQENENVIKTLKGGCL